LTGVAQRIEAVSSLAKSQSQQVDGYPGWKPDVGSGLLKIARKVHLDILGTEPETKAIHAGLECGIIKEKYPSMDMISIGPQIEFPHSPDERVGVQSVYDFYKFLGSLLERLARPDGHTQ
jgi:dipeptidase D